MMRELGKGLTWGVVVAVAAIILDVEMTWRVMVLACVASAAADLLELLWPRVVA